MKYYVKAKPSTSLRDADNKPVTELLWGDLVHPREDFDQAGGKIRVWARGQRGWVEKSKLRKQSSNFNGLLEIYVIDVGQGDGVLVRTPDDRWHLIDAGVANFAQMTRKGAANFLRWKFYRDLRRDGIHLHSLTASHPDFDHYGGMLDLLSGELYDGRTFGISVDHFYHCGMGRYDSQEELGRFESGRVDTFPEGDHGIPESGEFTDELLDDLESFDNPPRPLKNTFGDLARLVVEKCATAQRLSHRDRFLPGYGPGDSDVVIHVLGPVLENYEGDKLGLRKLAPPERPEWWESKTRNGHSITYRLNYGEARILLTGDLNTLSQQLLLSYIPAREFAADVAKGCHHGAEDILVDFVKAMQARATVISSGDNESYAHPRPVLMGASARYGRESVEAGGGVLAPLLYSTELARSTSLAFPTSVRLDPDFGGPRETRWFSAKTTEIKTKNTKYRLLQDTAICTDLIYGLVNVRTDGETVLCATMLESGNAFDTKMFKAGVEAA